MMKRVLLFLSISFLTQGGFAQWKKIAQFPSKIISVYFQDEEETPQNGFVGVVSKSSDQKCIWFTKDSGQTWTLSASPAYPLYQDPANFTFKDSLVGWVWLKCIGSTPSILTTSDGGRSWQVVSWLGDPYSKYYCGVKYHKPSSLLFSQNFIVQDGIAVLGEWGQPGLPERGPKWIAAFSNDTNGILMDHSGVSSFGLTNDGGMSWMPLPSLNIQAASVLAIKNSQIYFLLGKGQIGDNSIYRTNDAGLTWSTVAAISPFYKSSEDGQALQGNLNALYIMSLKDGVIRSTDEGFTWHSICGPSWEPTPSWININTPLYAFNDKLYAADEIGGLWCLNTATLKAEPQFSSDTLEFISSDCNFVTLTLYIQSQYPCGITILQAEITGSSAFSYVAKQLPYNITSRDSMELSYSPSNSTNDTSWLHLHYRSGQEERDTIILLFGSVVDRDSLDFLPSVVDNHIPASEIMEYFITPSKSVADKNLSEITFDVTLDEDLLEPIDFLTDIQSAIITHSIAPQTNGTVTYHLRITGTDMSLDPSMPIARIRYVTYITDTISTPIALSNVRLNSFDPDYERCTLSATSQDTTFTLALLCGDRTLTDFMRHGRSALEITSIHPNPAQDEVTVEIVAEGAVTIEVYDAVGKLVQTSQGKAGVVVVPVDMLSSGSYVMRVASGGEVVSRTFAVER